MTQLPKPGATYSRYHIHRVLQVPGRGWSPSSSQVQQFSHQLKHGKFFLLPVQYLPCLERHDGYSCLATDHRQCSAQIPHDQLILLLHNDSIKIMPRFPSVVIRGYETELSAGALVCELLRRGPTRKPQICNVTGRQTYPVLQLHTYGVPLSTRESP